MICHNSPFLSQKEELGACRAIQSNWLAQGKEVEAFENDFADFMGVGSGRAVAVSSGSAALYLALRVLDAKSKNVAQPLYVCSALWQATEMAGGHPVFLDSQKDSAQVDLQLLDNAGADIAIIPHSFGSPLDLSQVRIPLIEDCAQALGAQVQKNFVGLQGKLSVFSFSATKLITSGGQGGMIFSNDSALIDEIKDFRAFDGRHDQKLRFNFQMTDLQAAIGREQLKKLPFFLKRREEIFQKYLEACQKMGLELWNPSLPKGFVPVRYRAVVRTQQPKMIQDSLQFHKISSIVPIEASELSSQNEKRFPYALEFAESTLSLPIYPKLSDKEVDKIILALHSLKLRKT